MSSIVAVTISAITAFAQTTAFTYQGRLTDSSIPANGNFDFEFKLFDLATVGTGNQQGPTVTRLNVMVTAATFSVQLDFGVCTVCFPGAKRYLGLVVFGNRTVAIGALDGFSSTFHICYNAPMLAACSSAAEYVPSIDSGLGPPETADVVSLVSNVNPYDDEHAPFVVAKSTRPCDENLLGFIVNPQSGADGKKLNEHYLRLAVYGYFPVKVTTENGAIRRGDALTSSSKAGYAMKATQACKIIGYALEDTDREGKIQVFAHLSEHTAPQVSALQAQVEQLRRENTAREARLAAVEQAVRHFMGQQQGQAQPGGESRAWRPATGPAAARLEDKFLYFDALTEGDSAYAQ